MKKFLYLMLYIILSLSLISCNTTSDENNTNENTEKITLLVSSNYNKIIEDTQVDNENTDIIIDTVSSNQIIVETVENNDIQIQEYNILPKYRNSDYIVNEDFIGWIKNSDCIDYPIMQSQVDSNYYLRRDFNGNSDKAGSIYIPWDVTLDDKIVLIYGHNMKNNSMFGTIDKYLDIDYYNEHKLFNIDTLYKEKVYEVVCLFESKVYDDSYTGFEYYNYRGNVSELEFNEYKEGIKDLIKVGDISDLTYEDNIIELITCWYSTDDARLVLVCKELK